MFPSGGAGPSFATSEKEITSQLPDTKPAFRLRQLPQKGKARDRKITPDELLWASKWFDRDPIADQGSYEEARRYDWTSIHIMSLDDIKIKIGRFLNDWGAFGPYPIKITDELAKAIKDTFTEKIIYRIFKSFSNIGMRFREVATSKLLHQVNPKLFVM